MAKHMSDPTPRSDSLGNERSSSQADVPPAQGIMTRRVSERTSDVTRSRSASGSGGGGVGGIFLGAILLAAIAALVVFVVLPRLQPTEEPEQVSRQVTVSIPEGTGAASIASILAEAEVIDDIESFMKEAARSGKDSQLKPGTYSMRTHSSNSVVLDLLVAGPNTTADKITIPEGRTVGQTAALLEAEMNIDSEEFIRQVSATSYVADYPFLEGVNEDSLEGFLYGKTYDFSGKEHTPDTAIRAMLSQYQTEVASIDMSGAIAGLKERYGVEMSEYDILRMASIIEREAVTEEDRPLVSSVFYNRLAIGMYLQSDATMMYVTGGEVTAADLEIDNPYNTYLYPGFPPTPICSPSIESIRAALAPADTNYYYFFIVEDGERSIHAFSETHDEHLEVINSY